MCLAALTHVNSPQKTTIKTPKCLKCQTAIATYKLLLFTIYDKASNPEETTAIKFDTFFFSVVLLIKNDNDLYLHCGMIAEFYWLEYT